MIDNSKHLTLRFKLCNLIYRGYFKEVFAFDRISLDNFIKYGGKFEINDFSVKRLIECIMRLNYLIGGDIENVVSDDGDKILVKRPAFIIADWLYGGYLSMMLPAAISLLQAVSNCVKANNFKLSRDCALGVQKVIDTYEHIMFEY